jgi:hypothetical protein
MIKKKKSFKDDPRKKKKLTKKVITKKRPAPKKPKGKVKVIKVKKPVKPSNPIKSPPALPEVSVNVNPKKRRTRRSKSPSKIYFDEGTELAIITYNNLPDWANDERNRLFEDKIRFPFEKLVENIFNTFKFSYFETSPQDVQKETVSHLVANMHKFDKRKGKAFAYFSIIAKHFLIFLNNSNYKRFNQNVDISEERDDHTVQLQASDTYNKEIEINEFMRLMVLFWENNVGKIFTKQRDLNIANAVIELFRNSERIDSFNKKALYLYIREISSCKTQQITKVINRMKQYQSNITRTYKESGFVNTDSYTKA